MPRSSMRTSENGSESEAPAASNASWKGYMLICDGIPDANVCESSPVSVGGVDSIMTSAWRVEEQQSTSDSTSHQQHTSALENTEGISQTNMRSQDSGIVTSQGDVIASQGQEHNHRNSLVSEQQAVIQTQTHSEQEAATQGPSSNATITPPTSVPSDLRIGAVLSLLGSSKALPFGRNSKNGQSMLGGLLQQVQALQSTNTEEDHITKFRSRKGGREFTLETHVVAASIDVRHSNGTLAVAVLGHRPHAGECSRGGDSASSMDICTAGGDGMVRVWHMCMRAEPCDASTYGMELVKEWHAHAGSVTCMASWRESKLYTGGRDAQIRLWDSCDQYKLKACMTGHRAQISALTVVRNKVYSAGWDGSVRVWDTRTHSCIKSVEDTHR
jgi:WD40 repeat protein